MNINSSELKKVIMNRAKGITDDRTLREIRENREREEKKRLQRRRSK